MGSRRASGGGEPEFLPARTVTRPRRGFVEHSEFNAVLRHVYIIQITFTAALLRKALSNWRRSSKSRICVTCVE